MSEDFTIQWPTLVLDTVKVRRNIELMADKMRRLGVSFRPHFKTHQSHTIGNWFREEGVKAITTSSMRMAKYFAEDGWDDITVAFPFNLRELPLVEELTEKTNLNILIESTDVVRSVGRAMRSHVGVFIKIDVGTHRTGLSPDNLEELDRCINEIGKYRTLAFKGFLAHAGHTYNTRNEIEKVHGIYHDSQLDLNALKGRYLGSHPGTIISFGDTPGASMLGDISVDEMRPGNFVFYDLMQVQIGSCSRNEIGVALVCPVVARHDSRNECVIYGGAIHLSKEAITVDGRISFGEVYPFRDGRWDLNKRLGRVDRMSQEHGVIRFDEAADAAEITPGDLIAVLPVHSCLTAQCMGEYYDSRGSRYDHFAGS